MNDKQLTRTSKFLSLVLRHEPERIGLTLDAAGWIDISALIQACNSHGKVLNRTALDLIVATSDKKRFAYSEDGLRIRANQGHSVEVSLGYTPQVPPDFLYHGTATRFLSAISTEGLDRRERHHVHLSADKETALKVGQRHGAPVILVVRAGDMHRAGRQFFLSENGVWLTDYVPVDYINFPIPNSK